MYLEKLFFHSYTTTAVSQHTANPLFFAEVILQLSLHISGFYRYLSEIVTVVSNHVQYSSLIVC